MSHYRSIEIDNTTYRYVVGRHRTNIVGVGVYDNSYIGYVYSEDITEVRPSDIEKVIRRALKLPQREYDWDTPVTKVDPGPRTRGFRNLIGETIVDIKVSANNGVILTTALGERYAIESITTPGGISVVSLRVLE